METERLILKIIDLDDTDFLYALMNTEKWHLFIGDKGVDSIKAAKKYIMEKMHPDITKKGFVNHVITDKMTNTKVGTCSLHDRPGIEGMDIGYALLPEYEGKGYANESAEMMIKLAFDTYKQEYVSAITSIQNTRSSRLLEKLRFQYKKLIQLPNSLDKVMLYVLQKEDYTFNILKE